MYPSVLRFAIMSRIKYHAAFAVLPLLIGCSTQQPPPQTVKDVTNQMLGMSRQEAFTCIGLPPKKSVAGEIETWSYTYDVCTVNLTMAGDSVKAVTYQARTSESLTEEEQCAKVPVVAGCLRWLRN